jgi:ribosomal protein S21
MGVTNIRVVSKNLSSHASYDERERAWKILFATFKRQVNESGILTRYKECQVFESKTQKRRRKQREADLQRRREQDKLKTTLREHFGGSV